MKIRTGFVSNSSSSSFVVVYKVNVTDELKKYMAEEYGKYGAKLLDDYVMDEKEVREWLDDEYGAIEEEDDDYGIQKIRKELEGGAKYLTVRRVYNSNDPDDMNDDGCWLADHIPAEFKEELYEEEPN